MAVKKKVLYYQNREALAFPDVYLYPAYSDIRSRFGRQIDTQTAICLNAPKLKIPFISAGMDTVTEDEMAITMALNGGLGEIHRNNTADHQANMVRKVKEVMRVMEKNPPVLPETATVGDALSLIAKRRRGYVVVYPGSKFDGRFTGIATDKDFLAGDPNTSLIEVMTPLRKKGGRKLITGNKDTTLEQAQKIMIDNRVEKLPVIDSTKKLVGIYTLKDTNRIAKYPNAVTDSEGRLLVGAAIGVHQSDIERAIQLTRAGVDILFLDIAHGHSVYSKEMMHKLKTVEKIKTPIVVGNVATKDGVLFACDIGADGIKVGIGPGFVCKTRNVAGTGVPQITAVMDARKALQGKENAPPIISDGGIREPGDSPKTLAAGADSVMIGSLLAGTDSSPGDFVRINGTLQKRVRGMASKGVLEDRKKLGDSTTDFSSYTPEGRETFTHYQGSTQEILMEYIGGLRSAMSYAGAHTIPELQQARLIHVSASGAGEQNRPLG